MALLHLQGFDHCETGSQHAATDLQRYGLYPNLVSSGSASSQMFISNALARDGEGNALVLTHTSFIDGDWMHGYRDNLNHKKMGYGYAIGFTWDTTTVLTGNSVKTYIAIASFYHVTVLGTRYHHCTVWAGADGGLFVTGTDKEPVSTDLVEADVLTESTLKGIWNSQAGYNYVEAVLDINDADNPKLTVAINGVTHIDNYVNAAMKNPNIDTINLVVLPANKGTRFTQAGNGNPTLTAVDDLYVFNGDGDVNTDFFGPIRISSLRPVGAGDIAQLTPIGAATNWQVAAANLFPNVSETPTIYNRADTANLKDMYEMDDTPSTVGPIKAVAVEIMAATTGVGAHCQLITKYNSVEDANGILVSVPQNQLIQSCFDLDPEGNAWSKTVIDAMTCGFKRVD